MGESNDKQREYAISVRATIEAMGYNVPNGPSGGRIWVIRDEPHDKSKGGIIIPENAQRKRQTGTVVGISTQAQEEEPDLKILDHIAFTKYEPILIQLADTTGNMMDFEVMHVTDMYVYWS